MQVIGAGETVSRSLDSIDSAVETVDVSPLTNLLDDLGKPQWPSDEPADKSAAPSHESTSHEAPTADTHANHAGNIDCMCARCTKPC